MIWPIGQPPGGLRHLALLSREHWLSLLSAAGVWHDPCGSLHLAYHDDELAVLEEFATKAPQLGYDCRIVPPREVLAKSPGLREKGLKGGLWSPSEVCVFSRQAIAQIPRYLGQLGVEFHFGCPVTAIDGGSVRVGADTYSADHVIVCPGDDLKTLMRSTMEAYELTLCKLQMLRLRPRQPAFKLGAHVCAGLTLGHYANFKICETLTSVVNRHRAELPAHSKFGIHLLVSQHEDGCLTVGDSHEYGNDPSPFASAEIEGLILDYFNTFLNLDEFSVIERWTGVYAKHPNKPFIVDRPQRQVTVVTGMGGAGMTLSFGLAAQVVRDILGT